ncbi:fibronectin type III domain-containing protein [Streptomyces sp. NPDC101116]|uniref:fibronectin type III domain-containing protein n=1 Tax=Streptomyces sp. NPDC101116 TaxID=3366107 RepID=UPI00380DEF87
MDEQPPRRHRRKKPRLIAAALMLTASLAGAAMAIGNALPGNATPDAPRQAENRASSSADGDEAPAPLAEPPRNDSARGMVYQGLQPAPEGHPCVGLYRLPKSDQCSHGPDAPPKGVDISKDTPPVEALGRARAGSAAAGPRAKGQCIGDGRSGNRVQVLYVHPEGQNRFTQYKASFKQWAAEADAIYNASAAETGGTRHIRYLTDADCTAAVTPVAVPANAIQSFESANRALSDKGFNRRDRKYMLFIDARVYCGIGTFAGDERPSADNRSNFGPSYARVDTGCWSGHVAAHELGHNLGAVNNSAPNSSKGAHCVDEQDVMCYSDAPYYPRMRMVCTDRTAEHRLDCKHDDYFHTAPRPGSYLATHWNVADNVFLARGKGTGPTGPTTAPRPSASAVTTTTATLTWRRVTGAQRYTVKVNGRTLRDVNRTRLRLTGLRPGTTYTVSIRLHTAQGVSRPGPALRFTTRSRP